MLSATKGTPPAPPTRPTWGESDTSQPSPIPVIGTQTQPDLAIDEADSPAGIHVDPPAPPLQASGTIFAATHDSSGIVTQPAAVPAVHSQEALDSTASSVDDSVVLGGRHARQRGGASAARGGVHHPQSADVAPPRTADAPVLNLDSSDASSDSDDDSVLLPGGIRGAKASPPPEPPRQVKGGKKRSGAASARHRFLDMSAEAEGGSEDEAEGGSGNEYDLEDSFIHNNSTSSQGGAGGSQAEVSINHAALNAELNDKGDAWGRMFGTRAGPMPFLAAALAAAEQGETPPRQGRRKKKGGGRKTAPDLAQAVGGHRRLRPAVVSDSDTSAELDRSMAPPPARKRRGGLSHGPTSDDSDSFIVHDVTAVSSSQHAHGVSASPGNCSFGGGPGTHQGYACDGCGLSPMVGTRYTCTVCEEFDLCEKCMPHKNTLHDLAITGASDGGPPHPFRAVQPPLRTSSTGASPPSLPTQHNTAARVSSVSSSGSGAFQAQHKGGEGGLDTSTASGSSSASVFDPLPAPAPRGAAAFAYSIPASTAGGTSQGGGGVQAPAGGAGGFNLLADDSDSDSNDDSPCTAPAASASADGEASASAEHQRPTASPTAPPAPHPTSTAAAASVASVAAVTGALPRVLLARAVPATCQAVHSSLRSSDSCAADTTWAHVDSAAHGLSALHVAWFVFSRQELVQSHQGSQGGIQTVMQAALNDAAEVNVFLTELPGTNIPQYMSGPHGPICAAAIAQLRSMGPQGVKVLVKRTPDEVAAAITLAAAAAAPPLHPLPQLHAPPGETHPPSQRRLAAQARFLVQRKGLPLSVSVALARAADRTPGGLTSLLSDLACNAHSDTAVAILGGPSHWRQALREKMK